MAVLFPTLKDSDVLLMSNGIQLPEGFTLQRPVTSLELCAPCQSTPLLIICRGVHIGLPNPVVFLLDNQAGG